MPDPFNVFESAHADPKIQAEIDKEEARLRQEIDEAWSWLMADEKGQLLLWFILSRCGVFRSSFNTQTTVMAFNEGRRSIGNFIVESLMTKDPAALLRITKRYHDARTERDRRDG